MRYQSPVTEFHPALLNLPAGTARLSAVLARPKAIALGCLAALTGFGWIALALMVADGGWAALCRPNAALGWSGLTLAFAMWAAMTLAMMLPTAGPMVLTYAEIADTAAHKREAVVSPLLLTAGYGLVWLGFAAVAATLQALLARAGWLDAEPSRALFAAVTFAGAGLYQFSALKHACLTQCQRPFPFFFANWTTEPVGVLRLGLRQGLLCLGCCWAMMAVMLAAGAMNAVWMAALGAIMTVEKMAMTPRFSRALGFAFVALGLTMAALEVLRWT
jgi:predicted metal-binding membrane protein